MPSQEYAYDPQLKRVVSKERVERDWFTATTEGLSRAGADALDAAQLARHWPSDWNEIGGYSAVPDTAKDAGADGVWELLVRKVALGGIQGR